MLLVRLAAGLLIAVLVAIAAAAAKVPTPIALGLISGITTGFVVLALQKKT